MVGCVVLLHDVLSRVRGCDSDGGGSRRLTVGTWTEGMREMV